MSQGQSPTVVLLSLIAVDRGNGSGLAKERVLGAAVRENILDEGALASVRGKNGDAVGGIAQEAHVLVQGHDIFGLAEVLDPVRARLRLAQTLVVGDIDKLKVKGQAGVGEGKVDEIVELGIAPAVELSNAGASAALLIEQDGGDAETDKTQEEGLLEVGEAAKGKMANDGRVLLMVAEEHHSFQGQLSVRDILERERNKRLDLGQLGSLLDDEMVIVESEAGNVVSTDGGMCRGHGNDTGFFDEQIIGLVSLATQELKGSNILQLGKDPLDMPVAAVGNVLGLVGSDIGREEGDIGEIVVYQTSDYGFFGQTQNSPKGNGVSPAM